LDFLVGVGKELATGSIEAIPSPLRVVAACYIAAAAVRAALGPGFPFQSAEPVVLHWSELFGPDLNGLRNTFDIGETYLAGAGAVGNGFLYTLRYFNVTGTLYVVDPKLVNSGGLNRCLLVNESDLGQPKASRICQSIRYAFPNLRLVPCDTSLGDARKQRGGDFLLERLVVAVDSRGARRSLQAELPKIVFDASTTDVREIVLHFNRQPTELACLSCVYPLNERERKHEENVAEALGIEVDEVRSNFCTRATAEKICRTYPDTRTDDLVGRAFDTVYKEFCGLGKLKADGGQQVLAPFSFVSVMAGALLAIEFALRSANHNEADRFNYWRLSPWHSPVPALRQIRPRDPVCEFCGNPVIQRALERVFA
jgi:molybdopterin/thiamine biosynthesis adenylyltransferase